MKGITEGMRDVGLLIIRVGLGGMFIFHGLPKLLGGPELWANLGQAVSFLKIDFAPQVWGFLAAFTETVGGVCLILGFLFRLFCLLLLIVMAVAATMHLGGGEGLLVASHAIENGIVFLGLFFLGPGIFNLDRKLFSFRKQ